MLITPASSSITPRLIHHESHKHGVHASLESHAEYRRCLSYRLGLHVPRTHRSSCPRSTCRWRVLEQHPPAFLARAACLPQILRCRKIRRNNGVRPRRAAYFLGTPRKKSPNIYPVYIKKMCAWWDEGKKKARIREFLHTFWGRDYFCFLFFFNLAYSRWTSSLPSSCLWSQRIFPSLPGSRLTIFYRDASSALLQLVNQWLNFTYSHSHAFRFERKNTNPTLVRIKLTTSALAGVQVTY